jgi:hypothetical protein
MYSEECQMPADVEAVGSTNVKVADSRLEAALA